MLLPGARPAGRPRLPTATPSTAAGGRPTIPGGGTPQVARPGAAAVTEGPPGRPAVMAT